MTGLKTIRKFGLTDRIPRQKVTKANSSGIGRPAGVVPMKVESQLLRDDMMTVCPLAGMEQSANICRTCSYFSGMVEIEVHGKVEIERKWRILCAYPKPRKISISTSKPQGEYRAKLEEALEHRAGSQMELERKLFLDNGMAINCPLSRAKTGVWRVENPPCLACDHYQGIKETDDGLRVLCDHYSTRQLRPAISGASLL
ncbi:hypothetical protein LCGC14_2836300 [marine sediment metagenome]|uniref:Uncharacterized protein n=1 Tax=marine sediment metagenome TaxID=412755 RepID=A0A0F9AKY5_9ZZZZ